MFHLILWTNCEPRTSSVLADADVKIKGNKVTAKWGRKWYPATVVKSHVNKERLNNIEVDIYGQINKCNTPRAQRREKEKEKEKQENLIYQNVQWNREMDISEQPTIFDKTCLNKIHENKNNKNDEKEIENEKNTFLVKKINFDDRIMDYDRENYGSEQSDSEGNGSENVEILTVTEEINRKLKNQENNIEHVNESEERACIMIRKELMKAKQKINMEKEKEIENFCKIKTNQQEKSRQEEICTMRKIEETMRVKETRNGRENDENVQSDSEKDSIENTEIFKTKLEIINRKLNDRGNNVKISEDQGSAYSMLKKELIKKSKQRIETEFVIGAGRGNKERFERKNDDDIKRRRLSIQFKENDNELEKEKDNSSNIKITDKNLLLLQSLADPENVLFFNSILKLPAIMKKNLDKPENDKKGLSELCERSGIWVETYKLLAMRSKYRKDPPEFIRSLYKTIIGVDKLKHMSVSGRGDTVCEAIPQNILDAIYVHVNENISKALKIAHKDYIKIIALYCNTLRTKYSKQKQDEV